MARSGAGIEFGEGRVAGCERAFCGIKTINQDFIEAEINNENVVIVGGRGE